MIAQDLRQTLEGIDLRPRFWGLQWSCPSPWEVLGGIKFALEPLGDWKWDGIESSDAVLVSHS